eukprot:3078127-Amphidinium_carterae.1
MTRPLASAVEGIRGHILKEGVHGVALRLERAPPTAQHFVGGAALVWLHGVIMNTTETGASQCAGYSSQSSVCGRRLSSARTKWCCISSRKCGTARLQRRSVQLRHPGPEAPIACFESVRLTKRRYQHVTPAKIHFGAHRQNSDRHPLVTPRRGGCLETGRHWVPAQWGPSMAVPAITANAPKKS